MITLEDIIKNKKLMIYILILITLVTTTLMVCYSIEIGVGEGLTLMQSGVKDVASFRESLEDSALKSYIDANTSIIYGSILIIIMLVVALFVINLMISRTLAMLELIYYEITGKKTLEERVKALEEKGEK
jgi:hypothetical protein